MSPKYDETDGPYTARIPVYVDSPMALAALDVYREAVAEGGPEIRPQVHAESHDPFDPGELHLVHTPQESQRLDQLNGPCIIVSASGMATGGRVVHHLQHMLPQPRNLILLPGFQVAGTRGRALLDGARAIKMYSGYVPVRAEVKLRLARPGPHPDPWQRRLRPVG